ncbi:MAG: ATP-binding protein [Streptomyces sp.]
MVTPLRNQAADEQGTDEQAALRYSAAWTDGAARAADARQALRAFIAHASRNDRTPVPALLALDAELAVSELVTNAIRHTHGPCGMTLQLAGEELTITVWDTSPEKPTVHKRDPYRIGGHGLRLVHTVSHRVVVASQAAGKKITAHLHLRAGNGGLSVSP